VQSDGSLIGGPSSGLYAANTGEGTQIDVSTEHGKESLGKETASQIDLPEIEVKPENTPNLSSGGSKEAETVGNQADMENQSGPLGGNAKDDNTGREQEPGGPKTEGAPQEVGTREGVPGAGQEASRTSLPDSAPVAGSRGGRADDTTNPNPRGEPLGFLSPSSSPFQEEIQRGAPPPAPDQEEIDRLYERQATREGFRDPLTGALLPDTNSAFGEFLKALNPISEAEARGARGGKTDADAPRTQEEIAAGFHPEIAAARNEFAQTLNSDHDLLDRFAKIIQADVGTTNIALITAMAESMLNRIDERWGGDL
jgi:hypothetical protein